MYENKPQHSWWHFSFVIAFHEKRKEFTLIFLLDTIKRTIEERFLLNKFLSVQCFENSIRPNAYLSRLSYQSAYCKLRTARQIISGGTPNNNDGNNNFICFCTKKVRVCSMEILKRSPTRYQDPVLWKWLRLNFFFTPHHPYEVPALKLHISWHFHYF